MARATEPAAQAFLSLMDLPVMNWAPPLDTWIITGELNLAPASITALAVEELTGQRDGTKE